MAREPRRSIAEDLVLLDTKIKQLKHEYEQYFLGHRPRAPALLRSEVQKLIAYHSNHPIPNSALRFRFNNLCARFFAYRRYWDNVLRQIEEGTYVRHRFRAELRERRRGDAAAEPPPQAAMGGGNRGGPPSGSEDLFEAYLAARRSCGEPVEGLTRERLAEVLARQEQALRARYGCERVRFRVAVENGRTRLKAIPVGGRKPPREPAPS